MDGVTGQPPSPPAGPSDPSGSAGSAGPSGPAGPFGASGPPEPPEPAGHGAAGELSWSPPPWRIAAYAAAGLALLAVALVEDLAQRVGSLDAAGRLLVAVVAVGLLVLAVRDALARPALRVGPGGIDYFDGPHLDRLRSGGPRACLRRHLPWAAVISVQAEKLTRDRRLVHVRLLRIETIDGPVLLSRRQLGADPEQVAMAVEEHRLRMG